MDGYNIPLTNANVNADEVDCLTSGVSNNIFINGQVSSDIRHIDRSPNYHSLSPSPSTSPSPPVPPMPPANWKTRQDFGSLHHNYSTSPQNPSLRPSLREVIINMATCQKRSRILQMVLDQSSPAVRRTMFRAVRLQLAEIAVDQYGSYFIAKLIEVLEREDIFVFLMTINQQVHPSIKRMCTDNHGNKVMLKLVERLRTDTELQMVFMEGLSQIAVDLTRSPSCKQLIDNCLEHFAEHSKELLLNEIEKNWIKIAKDKNGCCVLQKCFRPDNLRQYKLLLKCAIQSTVELSSHEFGNYIMQYVIEQNVPGVAGAIAAKLKGKFKSLSVDIHASNVVEKLMKADKIVAVMIIYEIMENPLRDLLDILQNQYGNFVAQTALDVSKNNSPSVYNGLKSFIEMNADKLNNLPHGRNVVRAIKYGTRRANNRRR